ncbi:MAG: SDR family NAD(P)-dependent oxidoreductase [Aquificaceae bacterium]|nr:SDR family NAD(P)-dependent oxidoreductase [Aquificaceae bacterium]
MGLYIKACDVGDRRTATEFVDFCVEKLKKIGLLVNNASILGERLSIEDYPEEVWEEVIRVNINGVFYITKYALPYMSEGSVIVNMSSGAGKRPAPYWGAYAVSKFGVEGFSLLLAEELKGKGIRVYALNPGATRTQMRAKAYPQEDPNTLKPPEKVAEFMLKLISSKVPSGSYDYKDIRDV